MSLTKQRVYLIEQEADDEADDDLKNSNGIDEDDNEQNQDLIEVMSDSSDDSFDDEYDKFDIEDEEAKYVHEQMMDVH